MVKVATPLESTVAKAWVEDTRVFMDGCEANLERESVREVCLCQYIFCAAVCAL
jgi:hypothetical protein